MGYVVLHIKKAKGFDTGLTNHIERVRMPSNAYPELTCLNKELIVFPDGVADRSAAIKHRLQNAGLTRKIGKNQVTVLPVLLSGSEEDMKRIDAEGRLDEWCGESIR